MPFLDDPIAATPALLQSSRERVRLSRLYCEGLRTAYDNALDAILRSQQTIRHNERSMTPELAQFISQLDRATMRIQEPEIEEPDIQEPDTEEPDEQEPDEEEDDEQEDE
jgi:hypothetical protein